MAKKKSFLGLDVGTRCVKAVELSLRKGQPVVTGLGYSEYSGTDIESRIKAIREATASIKTKPCAVGVSGRSVCVRYIPVTAANLEELKGAIAFEADKYIPFEVADVYMDGQNITAFSDTGEAKELKALLVAVKKDVVEHAAKDAIDTGLTPWVVDVEAFALGNALVAQRASGEATGATDVPMGAVSALVDVGAFKTTVNIVKNGISHFSREVYVGGNDFTQALIDRMGVDEAGAQALLREGGEKAEQADHIVATVMEEMSGEVKLAIDYYENQFEEEVQEVMVCGGASLARPILDQLTIHLEKTVSRWDPFRGFAVEGADTDALGTRRVQFAIALGLAARIMES